ncbi:Cell division protein ZipA [Dissostichus eleginoides]|nr:Cell division protein ZipA [Dissostichus eleginoides]
MGKPTKKQSQPADDKSYESDTGDRMGASQNEEHAANHAPLTLADMEKLFLSMEERIISKLSVQLSADRATIDRHDQTIQGME